MIQDLESSNKILESTTTIRFPDCDPFGHLNNSRYLDYFINAREDQLRENYDLDIYQTMEKSWVVSQHQIAYLRPANLMEKVLIQSQLLAFGSHYVLVEMRMYNPEKSVLKSVLWAKFTHFNLRTKRSEIHSDEFMKLFEDVVAPVPETLFEVRVDMLRKEQVSLTDRL